MHPSFTSSSLPLTSRRLPGAVLVALLSLSFVAAPSASAVARAEAPARIGLLAAPGAGAGPVEEARAVVALLEAQLAAEPQGPVALVERQQLDAVLREQSLAACFGAGDVGVRLKLGRLVKADLLVVVRCVEDPGPWLEVIAFEPASGLRLATLPVRLSGGVEVAAARVREQIVAAVRQRGAPTRAVVAVSPLAGKDLMFTFAADGAAYARLIERSLAQRPGVRVVELAEARALAQELGVAGQPALRRALPLVLNGEFRDNGVGPARRVSLRLALLVGQQENASVEEQAVEPARVPDALVRLADRLLAAHLAADAAAAPDARLDAHRLYLRAAALADCGQWPDALSLAEASLLLEARPQAHELAAAACWRLLPSARQDRPSYDAILARGAAHLENYLAAGGVSVAPWAGDCVAIGYLQNLPPAEAFALYLRAASAKRSAGIGDWTWEHQAWLPWHALAKVDERLAIAAQVASMVVRPTDVPRIEQLFREGDAPLDPARVRAALGQLAACDNPLARREAGRLLEALAAGAWPSVTPAPRVNPEPPLPPADCDYVLEPLTLPVREADLGGISPAGDGADLLWTRPEDRAQSAAVWLLPAVGKPRRLGSLVAGLFTRPCFDGRYAWFPTIQHGESQIAIIDLRTGRQRELTARQGLPGDPIAQFVAAPLAPGRICAAVRISDRSGAAASASRSYLAVMSFDETAGPAMKVVAQSTAPTKPGRAQDPLAVFDPHELVVLRPAAAADGDAGGARTLLLDAAGLRVVRLEDDSATVHFPSASREWTALNQRANPEYLLAASSARPACFARAAAGKQGDERLVVTPFALPVGDPYRASVDVNNARVLVVSTAAQAIYAAAAPGRPFARLRVNFPQEGNGGAALDGRVAFVRSNVYGLLLRAEHGGVMALRDRHGAKVDWK